MNTSGFSEKVCYIELAYRRRGILEERAFLSKVRDVLIWSINMLFDREFLAGSESYDVALRSLSNAGWNHSMSSPKRPAYLAYIRFRLAGAHALKFRDKVRFIIRTQRESLIQIQRQR